MAIPGPSSHLLPLALAAAAIVSACAADPPRPVARTAASEPEEDAPSAQWQFVSETGKPARGVNAECAKVLGFVLGDKDCTGELCEFARDLGKEWLKRCARKSPAAVDDVRSVVDKISGRVDLRGDTCIHQGNRLLRTNECGAPEACVKEAQRWISSCGDRYATPLVVTILTRRSERRFTETTRVQFDTRSCRVLQENVSKGIGCDGEEKCKDALETVTAWQERCRKDSETVPIATAFAMADVLVGASRGVDPIRVDPDADRLDDAAFPLTLSDGKGTAAWVCGERPTSLDGYLSARAKCSPGELIFARLDAHQVRTVSVPHSSDADFSRLFPFLELKNERDARDKAELSVFRNKLREAVDSANAGKTSAASAQLAAALIPHAPAVARNAEYRKLLLESDAALARVLREWGKKKAAARVRDTTEAALFAGRSLANPLHDMRLDGSVVPGSFVAPSGFAWSDSMPESFAAYRKEIGAFERATRKPLSASRLDDLRERIQNDIAACAAAQVAVSKAEDASAACLFRDASCLPARAVSLSQAAEPDRERLANAQRSVALVLSSQVFSASQVQAIEADKVAAGCLD